MNAKCKDAQISQLIKTQDNEYISNKENENDCSYEFKIVEFQSKDSKFIKDLTLSWDIPVDNYYTIVGKPVSSYFSENNTTGYELNYLVSIDNKIIIIIPNQGGLNAYKINNNRKSAIYPYLKYKESHKWR